MWGGYLRQDSWTTRAKRRSFTGQMNLSSTRRHLSKKMTAYSVRLGCTKLTSTGKCHSRKVLDKTMYLDLKGFNFLRAANKATLHNAAILQNARLYWENTAFFSKKFHNFLLRLRKNATPQMFCLSLINHY